MQQHISAQYEKGAPVDVLMPLLTANACPPRLQYRRTIRSYKVLMLSRILQLPGISGFAISFAAICLAAAASAQTPQPLSVEALLDAMAMRAKTLSSQTFQPLERDLPSVLADMSYDQYRRINFRPEASLWRGESPFEVQFFYPGFLYRDPVSVRTVTLDGANTPVTCEPAVSAIASAPL